MPRVETVPRFEKAFSHLDPNLKKAARKALQNLAENPQGRGLNLELIAGQVYSIRVNRNFRILLRKKEDERGVYYSAEDIDSHDIYRRRR